jgi:hypothetical protein
MDGEFLEAFAEHFDAPTRICWPGPIIVPSAIRTLKRMWQEKLLVRARIGIGGDKWQPGFPRWAYCYDLPETFPECEPGKDYTVRR